MNIESPRHDGPKSTHHKEYSFKDFEDSENNFEQLLLALLPSIKRHEYSLIVGDDVSGRIPTLVLRKFITEVYRRDGIEPPETIFYAAGYVKDPRGSRDYLGRVNYDDISEDFKKRKKTGGKVLVVTEYIDSGRSLDMLVGALKSADIECEIAVLANKNNSYKDLMNLAATKIYSGGVLSPSDIIPFYKENKMAGVEKAFHSTRIHSQRVHQDENIVESVRADVDYMVQKMVKKYLSG